MKRNLRIAIPFVLFGIGIATWQAARPVPPTTTLAASFSPVPSGFVHVIRVVDGDTIVVDGNQKVRFVGVNTPETVSPTKPVQCYGPEASAFMKSLLVPGTPVRLVKDISETDKYGRLLRYVYMEDGTFVNLVLVQDGYAQVNTYPPDIAHAHEFQTAQAAAKAAGRGMWSACPMQ
ncbi:MAG TPA: thermonuclease family protein [Candidatus Paceibacterota bacterium]|nr:thermonuclease family protein [Candidatus Paceibacterota bacterium]